MKRFIIKAITKRFPSFTFIAMFNEKISSCNLIIFLQNISKMAGRTMITMIRLFH